MEVHIQLLELALGSHWLKRKVFPGQKMKNVRKTEAEEQGTGEERSVSSYSFSNHTIIRLESQIHEEAFSN